jgi:UDP-N-acetylmuramate--alanine ligase
MNNTGYQYAYFLGIGGIGMSALARYFHAQGVQVRGYDKTPTALTDALQAEGIAVQFDDTLDSLPAFVHEHPTATLFVYTPAIPAEHPQLQYLKQGDFQLYKRSEVLGLISRHACCIAVAGTHGKTTTSSLIACLLDACGINFTAFLGGISANFNNNYIHKTNGRDLFPDRPVVVLEADEFDRSFHRLNPDYAIITAIDPDHLDIYETKEAFTEAFVTFSSKIKPGGSLIVQQSLQQSWPEHVEVIRYGLNTSGQHPDCTASPTNIQAGHFYFDYSGSYRNQTLTEQNLYCGLPGFHNIENATAALALVLNILKLEPADVRKGLQLFAGVKRRFEYLVRQPDHTVIDDYAHHPEELRAILQSVRALYPTSKLTAIFQPHLFTRTRDFAEGFAQTLATADELILMDIYPARELPIPGIDSTWLLAQINHKDKKLMNHEAILDYVRNTKPELLLLLGAGDIDRLASPVKAIYETAERN